MDTTARQVPRIIPDSLLSILCILEQDEDRFLWKLSRNRDGLSLVINTHPDRSHRVTRVHRKKSKGRSFSGRVLEKDCEIPTKTTPLEKTRKKKCPSAIRRDKARAQGYWQQIKAARRKSRINASALIPTNNDQRNSSLNSVHTEKENSICELEHQTNVKATVEPLNSSNPSNLPSTSCDDLHREECVASNATDIDSDDDSDFSEQERVNILYKCARCKKDTNHTDFQCSRCTTNIYCSNNCKEADWNWHKFICKPSPSDNK